MSASGSRTGSLREPIALWILPEQALLPLALLAALAGLWFIASNQVLSIASFVVVSVGMNVVGGGLDPSRTLAEYIVLLLGAVVIGLLLGFVVVPHLEPGRVHQRVHQAQGATVGLLRLTARQAAQAPTASDQRALVSALQRVRTAVENLGSPLDPRDARAGVSSEECTSLATRFETLAIVGVLEAGSGRLASEDLSAAATVLKSMNDIDSAGQEAAFVGLARSLNRHSARVLDESDTL